MVSVRPSVLRKFRLKPSRRMAMNVVSSVVGIENRTMTAARGLCRNASTTRLVRMTAVTSSSSMPSSEERTNGDESWTTTSRLLAGNRSRTRGRTR
jgi:hypothetical protein